MTSGGYRPCAIVPIYNHRDTIRATVAGLSQHGIPVYVVDDGSDRGTCEELARVASDFPSMRLARLERNSGKGAAVMHAVRCARADGMTHALQVDADGQHDLRDIPRFLARGAARPAAVICGAPMFDASAPAARRYGRYFSHVWVWVETLSFAIGDSMCGFRLYPLAATLRVIDSAPIPERMDFDIAIVVRLAWLGVPVENLRTRVIYPAGGLSHFHMLRDNLRIIRTHARLVAGMVLRLPSILRRRLAPGEARS